MACCLAVAVDFDLLTTCSIFREEYDDNPSCPVCVCFYRGGGMPQMPLGFSWLYWYDQQGEPVPITLRYLLVLYTQLNVPSVILVCWFSSFDPLNKMILLSWLFWCDVCVGVWLTLYLHMLFKTLFVVTRALFRVLCSGVSVPLCCDWSC